MTIKEKDQFNRMLGVLKRISEDYYTLPLLRRNSDKDFGLDYHEALEMAYENIRSEAKLTVKGIRFLE